MPFLATALFAQPCKSGLHGHVYDKDSGAALSGRTVQAITSAYHNPEIVETVTNQAGYFEFLHLTPSPNRHVAVKGTQHWDSYQRATAECGIDLYVPNTDANAKRCRLSISGYVYEQESGQAISGHVVRATNGGNIVAAVANREGHFEFLNLTPGDWWITSDMNGFKPVGATPFLTLHHDSACLHRNLYLRRFGPREQIEETVGAIPGYAIALYQLVKEALSPKRQR